MQGTTRSSLHLPSSPASLFVGVSRSQPLNGVATITIYTHLPSIEPGSDSDNSCRMSPLKTFNTASITPTTWIITLCEKSHIHRHRKGSRFLGSWIVLCALKVTDNTQHACLRQPEYCSYSTCCPLQRRPNIQGVALFTHFHLVFTHQTLRVIWAFE